MEEKEYLKVEEVAVLIGSSIYTINIWYKWASLHPENELAQILPEVKQSAPRQTRYWKRSDLWRFIEFKTRLPKGCVGVMGDVTRTRRYKKSEEKHEKKTSKRTKKSNTGTVSSAVREG